MMRKHCQRLQSRLFVFPANRRHPMLPNAGLVHFNPNTARLPTYLGHYLVSPFLPELFEFWHEPSPENRYHRRYSPSIWPPSIPVCSKKSVLSSKHGMVLYQVTMMPPRGASPLWYNDATVRNFAAEVFSGSTTPGLILNIFQNGSGMQG